MPLRSPMLRLSMLALGLVTAGCAAPAAVTRSAEPPAPTEATPTSATVSLAALAPVAQPDLPAPLRPSPGMAAKDHGAHAAPASLTPEDPATDLGPMHTGASPLASALDAYLAIQDALASDDAGPVAALSRAFADAWARAVEAPPDADPHFWHQRMEATGVVRTHALALAAAAGLADAREAFGHLSAPFATLVEARGVPSGYDLSRFTCGMRSTLPDGGVWLQRGAAPRNPYYGSRMLTCATAAGEVPSRSSQPPAIEPESLSPEAMDAAGHHE